MNQDQKQDVNRIIVALHSAGCDVTEENTLATEVAWTVRCRSTGATDRAVVSHSATLAREPFSTSVRKAFEACAQRLGVEL